MNGPTARDATGSALGATAAASPIYWFARLVMAIDAGDRDSEAEARRRLASVGWTTQYATTVAARVPGRASPPLRAREGLNGRRRVAATADPTNVEGQGVR